MFKNKIIKDTIMLTVMQLFLDTSALLLNAFINRKLGTSAMGILSLTGSFLVLAGTVSNGSAFLCTSRLISEELGKREKNPDRVLLCGLGLCLILSTAVSAVLVLFSGVVGERFFHSSDMSRAVRLMPLALIPGAFAACFKGYFNAFRKSSAAATADILEFAVKAAVIIIATIASRNPSDGSVCAIMITGIIAGNCFSLIFYLVLFMKRKEKFHGKASLSFKNYVSLAIPVMGGGIITSALSSTNDALIPVTLRQYGDSVSEAFSRFGIFESIVIPTLFFPSVVLCSMSGIIVSEAARASAAGNRERIKSLSARLIEYTLIFAVFASAFLMRFGRETGELMGGGELAGKMISVIAPVVPFIYLEIILEALIKGMGLQGFSSLNYLAEYAVRISVVLIFVPHFGFYGIAASYYTSNVIGNCSRLIKVLRHTGVKLHFFRSVLLPVIYAFLTMGASELLTRIIGADGESIPEIILFSVLWATGYFAFSMLSHKEKGRLITGDLLDVNKKIRSV
ncbi:MAG: polysaccharide biosynthesis C-terminal domain-containing protein [Oscillospiraceae bacterium]|nr:polysaccharide biosynthesis C-terminal domain-containing protein [Oscillospiraceae bacterium]